jgi:maltodextrin utilization protein YvdJ
MQGSTRTTRIRRAAAWRGLRVSLVAAALVASGTAVPSSSWTLSAQTSGSQKPVREDLVKKLTGKKIRVDKQTGQTRAITQAEARETVQQLTALLERPAAAPQVAYRSNGTQVATVDGYFNRAVVARPRANGTFETRCVSTLDEAAAFLSGESAALEDR